MWSVAVIFVAPMGDFPPRVKEISKPTRVQTFITQLSRETLYVTILHGAAGLNVNEMNASFDAPGQKMTCSKFWTVITTDASRQSTHSNDLFEYSGHPLTRKAGINFQRQALSCERIDDAQHPNSATGCNGV